MHMDIHRSLVKPKRIYDPRIPSKPQLLPIVTANLDRKILMLDQRMNLPNLETIYGIPKAPLK
jgi:hypothetical protein